MRIRVRYGGFRRNSALGLQQFPRPCNLRLTSDDPLVGESRAFSTRRRITIGQAPTGYGVLSMHRKHSRQPLTSRKYESRQFRQMQGLLTGRAWDTQEGAEPLCEPGHGWPLSP